MLSCWNKGENVFPCIAILANSFALAKSTSHGLTNSQQKLYELDSQSEMAQTRLFTLKMPGFAVEKVLINAFSLGISGARWPPFTCSALCSRMGSS